MRSDEKTKDQLIADMAEFARYQIGSMDMDPAYPVLVELHKGMTREQALWHTILYVTYYNLTSGALAFAKAPEPKAWRNLAGLLSLPCATERRGHRTPDKIKAHLGSWAKVVDVFGSLEKFLTPPEPGTNGWWKVTERLEMIHGNGRWAAYKTAEILMTCLDWPIEAPGIGADGASGPAQGLALIFGETKSAHIMEVQAVHLQKFLASKHGLQIPLNVLETVLCDFHSLYCGRYYVGHDIDQMQAQIVAGVQDAFKHEVSPAPVWEVYNARARALPRPYLGEFHDWEGVDSERDKVYQSKGVVLYRVDERRAKVV